MSEDLEYPCQKCGSAEASLATLDVCDRCYISIVAQDTQSRSMQLQLPLEDSSPSFEAVVAVRRALDDRIGELTAARHQHELDGLEGHDLDRFG